MAKMLASQILSLVIRPALSKINLWSPSAEELVLGTAIGWMLLLVAIYALEVLYQNPNAAAPVLVSPKASAGSGWASA